MVSPVPRHLRSEEEARLIPSHAREHLIDLQVVSSKVRMPPAPRHRAKYASGLATELVRLAGTQDVGDPMAGVGTLAWETGLPVSLNDIDPVLVEYMRGSPASEVTCLPATKISWRRECVIFSPPYYPRTDRRVPNAHDDAKRGPVVGFRDAYDFDHSEFIGNPGGVDAILAYREAMTAVYAHMREVADRMVVVVKNWWRLGVELRLDWDTVLMCQEVGWVCESRHGWEPPSSLWSRYNQARGSYRSVEDIFVFVGG